LNASNPNNIPVTNHCDGSIDCNNWSDEGFSCDPSLAIATIVLGFVILMLVLFIIMTSGIIIANRSRGRIRASGVVFLTISSLATMAGLFSVFTFYGRPRTYVCIIRLWLIPISSATLIGALCAKQFRVWRVFGNSTMKIVSVGEDKVLFLILLFFVPDFIVIIVWLIIDTPGAKLTKIGNGYNLACTSNNITAFLLTLGLLRAFYLGVASLLAFWTRNFPSAFSEAKVIGFAIYNATIIGAIFAVVVGVLKGNNFADWIFIQIGLIFWFSSTFFILVAPKLYGLWIDRSLTEGEKNKLPQTTINSSIRASRRSTPEQQSSGS